MKIKKEKKKKERTLTEFCESVKSEYYKKIRQVKNPTLLKSVYL